MGTISVFAFSVQRNTAFPDDGLRFAYLMRNRAIVSPDDNFDNPLVRTVPKYISRRHSGTVEVGQIGGIKFVDLEGAITEWTEPDAFGFPRQIFEPLLKPGPNPLSPLFGYVWTAWDLTFPTEPGGERTTLLNATETIIGNEAVEWLYVLKGKLPKISLAEFAEGLRDGSIVAEPVIEGPLAPGGSFTLDALAGETDGPDGPGGATDGNDVLSATQCGDTVEGLAGDDTITGSDCGDLLDGGEGNDRIVGRGGDDTIRGGPDADKLFGGAGNDQIDGGGGRDRIDGGRGNDLIFGGFGNDRLLGGLAADTIRGGAGRDRIDGGAGNDVITGGTGADTFVFGAGHGRDRITDFSVGGGDRLLLAAALVDGAQTGAEVIDRF
ncbi:MAG: calcium-binding protein, partial [Gemmobacter sp.]